MMRFGEGRLDKPQNLQEAEPRPRVLEAGLALVKVTCADGSEFETRLSPGESLNTRELTEGRSVSSIEFGATITIDL